MDPQPILLTGASGFIGGRLLARLLGEGRPLRALARRPLAVCETLCGDLRDAAVLERACAGVATVVHCAGHAHAFAADEEEAAQHHEAINHHAAVGLAEAAARHGVRRFVLISSVKAAGHDGHGWADETCALPPQTAYGRAKRRAEEGVFRVGAASGMEVVVLRPAMTYGRGGRGNLERLAAAARAGWLPPLPDSGALRSLLHVEDAVSAIMLALDDADAAGRLFIAAHPQAHTVAEIQDALRAALGLKALRWRPPVWPLRWAGRAGDLLGGVLRRPLPVRSEVVARLVEGEAYSPARLIQALGWRPAWGLEDGVSELLGVPGRAVARSGGG